MKKWAFVVLIIAVVAGCGIEWFPSDTVNNNPNKDVQFSVDNKCPVPASSAIDSSPVNFTFALRSTASISVSGDPTSRFFLDATTNTEQTSGTIQPGQTVILRHTSSSMTNNIGIVQTNLTIAGKTIVWKTATVACPNNTINF